MVFTRAIKECQVEGQIKERQKRGRRNDLICRTSMLNERAGQLYKAVLWGGDETEARMGFKVVDSCWDFCKEPL